MVSKRVFKFICDPMQETKHYSATKMKWISPELHEPQRFHFIEVRANSFLVSALWDVCQIPIVRMDQHFNN